MKEQYRFILKASAMLGCIVLLFYLIFVLSSYEKNLDKVRDCKLQIALEICDEYFRFNSTDRRAKVVSNVYGEEIISCYSDRRTEYPIKINAYEGDFEVCK